MASEAVGEALQHGGPFTSSGPFNGPLGGGSNGQNVHAVDLFSGHSKSTGLTPDLWIAGGTVVGHADGPFVVFDHKNDRQLPELRHVQALKELPVVAGAISEEGCCHGIAAGVTKGIPLVAAGECRTEGHWNPFADEGKAAEQVVFPGEQVHRATAPLAATCFLAEQFAHHLSGGNAGTQGMNVIAIGAAEPVVLSLHGTDYTGTHRLLTVVEVHEAKHFAAVVHLRALVL